MAKSDFEAGGGNAAVAKLKKLDQYRNTPVAELRRIVEQRGSAANSTARSKAANSQSSDQAYRSGGGNAAVQRLRQNSGNRNMSEADLRRLVEQRGRKAVAGGPDKTGKPAAAKPKPKTTPAGANPSLSSEGIRGYGGRGAYARTAPTGSSAYNAARNKQIAAERERLKNVGNPPAKPSPAPSTSRPSTSSSSRSSGNTSSTSKPSTKPAAKPAGKVPASSETYRDGGKGLYQGSKEYRDKVGGSGNPLLNRFRQDMGRDASTGSKAEPKMSKPEDKSRYVAPNGQPYKGPAFGNDPKPAKTEAKKKEDDKKKMSLAERMRRRRAGLM